MESMAGLALSMVPLLSVVTAAVSGWCLSELALAASRAFNLSEDLLSTSCFPLSKLAIDVAPSSFAFDLVMAAVESVPPLAGPCSLLRQSATACLLSVPATCTISYENCCIASLHLITLGACDFCNCKMFLWSVKMVK